MMRHPQVTGFTVREPFLEIGLQAALLLQALLVPDVRLVNRYVSFFGRPATVREDTARASGTRRRSRVGRFVADGFLWYQYSSCR